jgi:hypothetical protein
MFKRLIKNKKAQNTAEYAILISLVVAGIAAMQTYAQRAVQGRFRDSAQYMVRKTSGLDGNTIQYEPYYLSSDYDTNRFDTSTDTTGYRKQGTSAYSEVNRYGSQTTNFTTQMFYNTAL